MNEPKDINKDPDRQGDDSLRIHADVDIQDEYDDSREEEADLEYRMAQKRKIDKLIRDDEIVSMAIETYNDHFFYYNIFRPHIIVWIAWFEKKYMVWDWSKGYYDDDLVRRDIGQFELLFKKKEKTWRR